MDRTAIKQVYKFEYQESFKIKNLRWISDQEIERRIAIAETVFKSMSNVLSARLINSHTKLKLIKCYIWSTMMYGCEAWTQGGRNVVFTEDDEDLVDKEWVVKCIECESVLIFMIVVTSIYAIMSTNLKGNETDKRWQSWTRFLRSKATVNREIFGKYDELSTVIQKLENMQSKNRSTFGALKTEIVMLVAISYVILHFAVVSNASKSSNWRNVRKREPGKDSVKNCKHNEGIFKRRGLIYDLFCEWIFLSMTWFWLILYSREFFRTSRHSTMRSLVTALFLVVCYYSWPSDCGDCGSVPREKGQ